VKVVDLSHDEVDALHAEVSKDRPVCANRVIEVLRKALNLSIRWGRRTGNPASGVHKNSEEKRERFLTDEEVDRLRIAIGCHKVDALGDIRTSKATAGVISLADIISYISLESELGQSSQ